MNGFVVGENVRISRSKKRDLNRVLFIYETHKPEKINDFLGLLNSSKFSNRVKFNNKYFNDKNNLLNYLNGYRSFFISWLHNSPAAKGNNKQAEYLERLEKLILKLNSMN